MELDQEDVDDWELFLERLAAELCPGCGAYGHTVAICPTQFEDDVSQEPEEVELLSQEPEEVELLSRETEGVELLSREPKGVELLSREPEGVELLSQEPEEGELL
ncbi:UNVERIFIED_CONTAM: hypothetical protein FKN15_001966 [Acipenser sinensis]